MLMGVLLGFALVAAAAEDDATSRVRVVQMNPYFAGRLAPHRERAGTCTQTAGCAVSGRRACRSAGNEGCWECVDGGCRLRNFETAKRAAGLLYAIGAEVIGIQELDPPYAPRIARILERKTGAPWAYRVSSQGIGGRGSGVGVFWRQDRIDLVEDLGFVDLETLGNGYLLRFHGAILKPTGVDRQFGFFSGKLVWGGGEKGDRIGEARKLRSWIDARMAAFPKARTRIIATDLNDTVGSPAYDVFKSYDDGGARKATSRAHDPKNRLDYLFWADGPGGASQRGFVTEQSDGRLGRSEYYGSDHRFVYGDALIP